MTGHEMDAKIAMMLKELGLTGVHIPDSRRIDQAGYGWPDWVIVGTRIIYREIKGSNDILSIAQRKVARAIMHAGGDWAVWGPQDFYPRGRVRRELESIA
jgi:hypothetical protein